jgi:hypothetical protein
MENNCDKLMKRHKFICFICGDMIDKDIILLTLRCDKCFYKPESRGDNYNITEVEYTSKENDIRRQ